MCTGVQNSVLGTHAHHAVLQALMHDSRCSVMFLDERSTILDLNAAAAQILGKPMERLIGSRLVDHIPDAIREKTLAWVLETSRRPGGVGFSECISAGSRWITHARPLPTLDGGPGMLCVTSIPVYSAPLAHLLALVHAPSDRSAALGSLATLTDREFGVAALIAATLADGEIVRELHRSVRTVHAHRRSLGEKLGMTRRSEVVELFRSRGLTAQPSHEWPETDNADGSA